MALFMRAAAPQTRGEPGAGGDHHGAHQGHQGLLPRCRPPRGWPDDGRRGVRRGEGNPRRASAEAGGRGRPPLGTYGEAASAGGMGRPRRHNRRPARAHDATLDGLEKLRQPAVGLHGLHHGVGRVRLHMERFRMEALDGARPRLCPAPPWKSPPQSRARPPPPPSPPGGAPTRPLLGRAGLSRSAEGLAWAQCRRARMASTSAFALGPIPRIPAPCSRRARRRRGGRVRLRGQPAEPPPPAPQAHPPVPVRRLGGRTLPAVRRGCPQNRARPPLASGNPMRGPRGRRSAGVVAPALRRLRRLRPWRAPGAGVGAARLPTARRRRAGPPRPPWSRPGQVPPVLSSAGAP